MSKLASRILVSFTLVAVFSVTAWAQNTHSVWSKKPLLVKDGQTNIEYNTFVKGNAAFAWTESTIRAESPGYRSLKCRLVFWVSVPLTDG